MENQPENLEQMLLEAEERGYQRGLNEQITEKMAQPGEWEGMKPAANESDTYQILARKTPTIWDS